MRVYKDDRESIDKATKRALTSLPTTETDGNKNLIMALIKALYDRGEINLETYEKSVAEVKGGRA